MRAVSCLHIYIINAEYVYSTTSALTLVVRHCRAFYSRVLSVDLMPEIEILRG